MLKLILKSIYLPIGFDNWDFWEAYSVVFLGRNEYECITCDGTGKIETTNTEKIKNPKMLFKFKDFYLSNEYVLDVINIIDSVKPTTVTIVSLSSSIWFKFDDVYAVFTGFNALTENINDYKIITIEE